MPKPYPKEFRDEVVRVALNREEGVRIKDMALYFGITESCLGNWLAQAARDHGRRSGPTDGTRRLIQPVTSTRGSPLLTERTSDGQHSCGKGSQ